MHGIEMEHLDDSVDNGDEPGLDDIKILWKRKVMMWHGCVTNNRWMLTRPRLCEEAVGGMKYARMAEPDSVLKSCRICEQICLKCYDCRRLPYTNSTKYYLLCNFPFEEESG